MGVLSKYHRYREAGEAANVNNVERFGQPHHSLFTSTKVLSLKHRIEITDDNENVKYRTQSKVVSLHDRTEIYDANDRLVAKMWKKFLSLHDKYCVDIYQPDKEAIVVVILITLQHMMKDRAAASSASFSSSSSN